MDDALGRTADDRRRALRIVIGENEVLQRDALERLLGAAGHHIAATAGDGDDLVRHAPEERPYLVIADVRMPRTQRDECLARRSRNPYERAGHRDPRGLPPSAGALRRRVRCADG